MKAIIVNHDQIYGSIGLFLHKNLKLFLGGKLYQWLRLRGHTSSFIVGGETEGAHGPLGSKRPRWSNLRPDRPTSYSD